MITMAMQMRADACTCDPVGGLPREIFEAPNDRGRHQGDDDDDHLDAGVGGYGDRRSAARDRKRGDVAGGHHHHHHDVAQVTEASAKAMAAWKRETTALVRVLPP